MNGDRSRRTYPAVSGHVEGERFSRRRRITFERLESRVVLSTNIALGAPVSLEGAPFFTDGWGGGTVVAPETIVDGVFLPRSHQWDQGAVWWDGHDGEARSMTIDLGGVFQIDSLIVQVDDNDAYTVYYRAVNGGSWVIAWDVPNYDVLDGVGLWGMQTRPNPADDTERFDLPAPIVTNALKIEGDAADSDLLFAVSEVQAFGQPIDTLTVITHGRAPDRLPPWVEDMAEAIGAKRLPNVCSDESIRSARMYREDGPTPPPGSCPYFLLFDWHDKSGLGLEDLGSANDDDVAGKLAAFVGQRLDDSDGLHLHFIGHSRGSFVNADAIRRLGEDAEFGDLRGKIKSVHMTTLDPQPAGTDGDVEAVIHDARNWLGDRFWADNYYQDISWDGEPDGFWLDGAYNILLTPILEHPQVTGKDHSAVHDWYHWTIASTNPPFPREILYPALMWNGGDRVGYYWSQLGGGSTARPSVDRSSRIPVFGSDALAIVDVPQEATFVQVKRASHPSLQPPRGVVLPPDLIDVRAEGLPARAAATVQILLPSGVRAHTYYKYGRLHEDEERDYYEFLFDGMTGAEINGNIITLHLVDGQRGDDDQTANGIIVDPGAPAVDILPPSVTRVTVSSSTWSEAFRAAVDPTDGIGYPIPHGTDQLAPLPWANLDRIHVQFSENVWNSLQPGTFTLTGQNRLTYSISAIEYDSGTRTATLSLAAPLGPDRNALTVADRLVDRGDNTLDGEWTNGVTVGQSGDGASGGAFIFAFNVLPGDINQSAGVSVSDVGPLRAGLGSTVGDANYSIFADLNGSGRVAVNDVAPLRSNLGQGLPSAPVSVATPAVPLPLALPAEAVDVSLSTLVGDEDGDQGAPIESTLPDSPLNWPRARTRATAAFVT